MTDDLTKQIADLEGEVMLAAFHGYRLPAVEKRLCELYKRKEKTNDR